MSSCIDTWIEHVMKEIGPCRKISLHYQLAFIPTCPDTVLRVNRNFIAHLMGLVQTIGARSALLLRLHSCPDTVLNRKDCC